ncbi:hypothetical protein [Kitasatospora sp. NBC_01539]
MNLAMLLLVGSLVLAAVIAATGPGHARHRTRATPTHARSAGRRARHRLN